MSLLSFLSGILSAIGLNEGLESEDKERCDSANGVTEKEMART